MLSLCFHQQLLSALYHLPQAQESPMRFPQLLVLVPLQLLLVLLPLYLHPSPTCRNLAKPLAAYPVLALPRLGSCLGGTHSSDHEIQSQHTAAVLPRADFLAVEHSMH